MAECKRWLSHPCLEQNGELIFDFVEMHELKYRAVQRLERIVVYCLRRGFTHILASYQDGVHYINAMNGRQLWMGVDSILYRSVRETLV
jgi:hypothetical protein